MEMKVDWTIYATKKVEEIFKYYLERVNYRTGQNIIQTIIKKTEDLEKNPFLGQTEDLLKNYKKDYRYLVSGNYKIIYLVKSKSIDIVTVFDTRQNPTKIKEFQI